MSECTALATKPEVKKVEGQLVQKMDIAAEPGIQRFAVR
jgi:hypothetical protein